MASLMQIKQPVNAQCRTLWPEQHFSIKYLQNNATDSVSKRNLRFFFVHIVQLICTTKIVGLEKNSNRNISAGQGRKTYSFQQLKVQGPNLNPCKFGCPFLPVLGPAALGNGHFQGVRESTIQKLDQYFITAGNILKDYLQIVDQMTT